MPALDLPPDLPPDYAPDWPPPDFAPDWPPADFVPGAPPDYPPDWPPPEAPPGDPPDPPAQIPPRNAPGAQAGAQEPGGSLLDDAVNRTLLARPPDDEGNGRCIRLLYGDRLAHSRALGWLAWNGRCWEEDESESTVNEAIFATLRRRHFLASTYKRDALVKVTVGSTHRLRAAKEVLSGLAAVPPASFDGDPDLLNVANGALDLRTGALAPHAPQQRFTYCLATPYDPAAEMGVWTDFLAQVVGGGAEMVDYLQMAVGYSLTGHTSEECLWYIHGPARSGKGVFTETLLELLGTPLAVEVDFATFTARREGDTQNFDLAPLKPARLVITSESNAHETLNPAKIKQITGGNFIRCSFKHRTHFTYRPQFKAWLVSNHPVRADVDDDALWRRVKVLSFPHSFAGREDRALKRRLRAPEVLRGVLRWAVDGAMRWYAAGQLLPLPRAVEEVTQAHRAELDMVGSWLGECCTQAPGAWEPHAALLASYVAWCRQNGVTPKGGKGLTQALKARGLAAEVKWVEGKALRAVCGVRLTE